MDSENQADETGKISGLEGHDDGPTNEFSELMRLIVPLIVRRWAVLRHVVGPEIDTLKYYAARIVESERE